MPTYPLTGSAAAEVEARLAVMRLGQTRLGFMDPLARISINGTDRTNNFIKGSLIVEENIDNMSTATFLTRFDPTFTPVEGQSVVIGFGSLTNRRFAGYLLEVTQIHNEMGTNVRYSMSCQDKSWKLDQRMVNKVYPEQEADDIVKDVVASFTSGFTTNHVMPGLGAIEGGTPFTMTHVSTAITRLAEDVGAKWRVDPIDDLHFYVPSASNTTFNPHPLTSAYKDFEDVVLHTDISQIKNRVYVEGGGSTLSAPWIFSGTMLVLDNALFADDGGQIRLGAYAPVNGRTLTYSGKNLTTELIMSNLGVEIDDELLASKPGDGSGWPEGSPVNIWVTVEDGPSQAALAVLDGTDGIREMFVQDHRLNKEGATERGNGLLNRWKNPIERLTYRTHDPNTRPGGVVTVSLSSPISITGEFIIQRVTVQDAEEGRYRHPWYVVEASSQRRTLLDILQDGLGQARFTL